MALEEGSRLVKPETIKDQFNWKKFDAVVVLGLAKPGEENEIWMSTLTIDELAFLTQQLQAHLAYKLGPMKEGS